VTDRDHRLYVYISRLDIWLYTWPDLYIRLVTYARLHILTLVVPFCHKISYISFISCSWLSYYPSFQLSCFHCLYCCCARSPFSLHTHSLGRFWRLWIRTSRVLGIFLYCSGFRVIVRFARGLEFLPFDSDILASYYSCFYIFLDFMYIGFSLYSNLFIWYHAWVLICNIAVIVDILWFRFITCSDHFRLSVYEWGIFLAYISGRLSSRFHVFWEAGRNTLTCS